jgi:predicted alpha-1,6-mannanase (GH76 family)
MQLRSSLICKLILTANFLSVAAACQGTATDATAAPDAKIRVKMAMRTLMRDYDPDRGLWNTEGWWNAANSITVLGEGQAMSASAPYAATLENTFNKAQKTNVLFRNQFYDDEGWWALAWIQAYDVTHRAVYLSMAESIFSDMTGGWDDTCGGGIWWKKNRQYKNAIANELFLSVAAHLATRVDAGKKSGYLAWAQREWSWFDASGMINDDSLVNDGLTAACKNNERTVWSYNQGVLIGGLTELSKAAKDAGPLREATVIAHAALTHLTDANLVLHDRGEPHCSQDTMQFKGIFVRNLFELNNAAPDDEFVKFFRSNANSIWKNARTEENDFACTWTGPPTMDGAAATTSALDTLVAAAALRKVQR